MRLKLPDELICCLPTVIEDPIRIGCASDGGYIIPKKLLDHCDDVLSCGLGENWSFDRAWKEIKPNSKIHMYDGTVSVDRMKDYLRSPYRAFFPSQAIHFEENIGPGFTEFSKAIERLDSKRVLLKMDIEGGEFPLLDEILAHKDIFPGIVIEIHFANHRRAQFVQAVKKLQQEYELLHLHGNNHTTFSSQDNSCDCYEFTFMRRDLCSNFTKRHDFYLKDLDVSNVPGIEDYEYYFEEHKPEFSIAVLMPTRGRTTALKLSTSSLIDNADDAGSIQILFAFDNDDTVGLEYFETVLQPYLDKKEVSYLAMCFDSLGYEGLNQYYNTLANNSDADWLFVWNDDCVMKTKSWDTVIRQYDGQFKILKVHTHNEHPYSIFPIVPVDWMNLMGHLSRHQMIDAEISQIAFLLDLIEVVDIEVLHDRADLTGNNQDNTDAKRIRLEGNPTKPGDFNHDTINNTRLADAEVISQYMRSQGIDTTFWENVKALKQDPWEKLKLLDINHQQFQFDYK
jgi:hypothetical protein